MQLFWYVSYVLTSSCVTVLSLLSATVILIFYVFVQVYDITDRESFDAVVGWIEQIKTHADSDISVILLANKCDLEKVLM